MPYGSFCIIHWESWESPICIRTVGKNYQTHRLRSKSQVLFLCVYQHLNPSCLISAVIAQGVFFALKVTETFVHWPPTSGNDVFHSKSSPTTPLGAREPTGGFSGRQGGWCDLWTAEEICRPAEKKRPGRVISLDGISIANRDMVCAWPLRRWNEQAWTAN